jgi:hypothetical protein
MADSHIEIVVPILPHCDICARINVDREAYADARLPTGAWGNVCFEHFEAYDCRLGLGVGQRYIEETGAR